MNNTTPIQVKLAVQTSGLFAADHGGSRLRITLTISALTGPRIPIAPATL